MRNQYLLLSAAAVVVGFVLLASPAAAIDTCATNCNCTVSCSTSCLYGKFFPEPIGFQTYAENCGEYGLCAGQGSCNPPGGNCPAQACTTTINGGASGDTINGGSARECINGNGGSDTIDGKAGDDTIHGNDGTDTLLGDSGNDCLYGDQLNDYLDGGSGYDLTDGGSGTGDTCLNWEIKTACP